MKRIPNRDWFTSHAVKAILEVSEGTLYEMIRTGEIWEPIRDRRGRNVWSFSAVADACRRQINRWLDEDLFAHLQHYPSRRHRHTRDELEDLRDWIGRQELKRRRFKTIADAAKWEGVHAAAIKQLDLLQSMSALNARQRLGAYFAYLRSEGDREAQDEQGNLSDPLNLRAVLDTNDFWPAPHQSDDQV